MDKEFLYSELQCQYDHHFKTSQKYFEKWITSGDKSDYDTHLLHCGAAYFALKMKRIIADHGAYKS